MIIELLVAAVVLVTIGCIFWLGVPPVSSSSREASAVVELLRPHGPTHITDLGAGWGALVTRLARAFPASQVEGYELSPLPWLVATLRCLPLKNAHIRFGDFRKAPLPGAVVCYLARAPMLVVSRLLRPGQLLVTVCFFVRDRVAEREVSGVALYRA